MAQPTTTPRNRGSQNTEFALHTFRIDVQPVDSGNPVKQVVDYDCKRDEALAERLGNRDPFQVVVVLLELPGGEIRHDQCDDVADDGCKEPPPDIVRSKIDYGTDEGKMPVVPEINVDGACRTCQKHEDIYPQANGNDESAH